MDKNPPKHRLDKAAFFADLGYEPHVGQQEIHDSQHLRRVVVCGVRWGKSLCAAMEAVAAAMQPMERSFGWVAAPTYDLADKVFREIVFVVFQHLRHRVISFRESEKRLVLRNMGGGVSEIRAKSADNPVSLLGEGLDWLVVDEAARLRPTVWNSHLSQRLIDKRGWALLISTPKGKGFLHELHRRGRSDDPDFASWSYPSWKNPHLDRELIERERERLPKRVFDQEYGAAFVEGAGAVFRNVRECTTGDWQEPVEGEQYFAGLDLAKVTDYTVLVIMNAKREVVFVDRFHRIDWSQQVQRIRVALERFNHAVVLVDSTGAGEPVFEEILRAGVTADPYRFSAASKAALIDNLALQLEQRRITLPKVELMPELADELESFEFTISDAGNTKSGAPPGGHDDIVISLALAAWQLREDPGGPVIHYADWSTGKMRYMKNVGGAKLRPRGHGWRKL